MLQRIEVKAEEILKYMLATDSTEYEILSMAVEAIGHLDQAALTCEIGLREGGGTRCIIDALVRTNQSRRTHVAIDPYGNIEYKGHEDYVTRYDYTNSMRNKCMFEVHSYAEAAGINILVFVLEDTEFFNRFPDGIPVYENNKRLARQYALVHLDGPHYKLALQQEVDFFLLRMLPGGIIVFDDISNYDHFATDDGLHPWLLSRDLQLWRRGDRKAAYKFIGCPDGAVNVA